MDFTLADMIPHPSGAPADTGVRPSRASTASSSSGSRKSFSAELQGARADERRMEAREAAEARSASMAERQARSREVKDQNAASSQAERAEVRSTDKSEREAQSRETQAQNASATPAERAEARSTNKSERGAHSTERSEENPSLTPAERANGSSSEAQVQGGNGSSSDVRRGAEDSRTTLDVAAHPGQSGLDAQGQALVMFVSPVPPQEVDPANDQRNVDTEGEGDLAEQDHGAERNAKSGDGGSPSPLIAPRATNSAVAVSDLTAGHARPEHERNSPLDRSAPEPDTQVVARSSDSHKAQVVKPASSMVADDVGLETANRVDTRPASVELQPSSALPQPETIVRQVSPTSLGVRLPDGKLESPKPNPMMRDEVSADRSNPVQMHGYAQSLQDAQDSGVRTSGGGQQGQRASVDGTEGFRELWGDRQELQRDQSEIKLPQATVSDRPVSDGQATESMMAGAHGRVVSSPLSPPPPTAMSPAQPAIPSQETAESSMRFMTRSVVLDVAQPDLGHVNIRVAMTNDMVHTYLSADRLEVGQVFVNGQDRLQAALQANGLDMGQFRVDIDRQSAGRSFQQDSSPEQGHSRHQGSTGTPWGQSPDRQDAPRTSPHGLLNVVA